MHIRKVFELKKEEEEILTRIVDNPGITTLRLAETSNLSFSELISILKALLYSNLVRQTPKTEWYSIVEEVKSFDV